MNWSDIVLAVMKWFSDLQYFIAGLMGAAVATRYNKEQLKTPRDYAVFILSGAFTAQYLTLLILKFTPLEAQHAGGVGFLTGAIGGLILQELIAWIKSGAWKNISFISYLREMLQAWANKGGKK